MTVKNDISRHSNFYVSTVTFLSCIAMSRWKIHCLRVQENRLRKSQKYSATCFRCRRVAVLSLEGTSDENPIRIDRTSKDDFEQLLKALLHRKYGSQPNLPHGIEQWTSVLKLSTAWNFERLRQAAINALTESGISTVDRVVLSQRYYIKNWLLPALNELARRPEPITLEEAQRMGIDIALKLASVRERVTVTVQTHPTAHPPYSAFGASVPYQQITNGHGVAVGSCRDSRMQDCDFSDQIRSTFSAYEL
ncbi:hypothetical protein EDD16DRAFT_967606 [Pisolithus croceorrhizus]|nr:hypothetical protein EDD16DRAFT_967606 [Pisolithus croceorrhizus]